MLKLFSKLFHKGEKPSHPYCSMIVAAAGTSYLAVHDKAEGHLKGIEAKLNNEAFTSKAPAHIVQNQRDQAEKLKALIAQLEQSAAAMQ